MDNISILSLVGIQSQPSSSPKQTNPLPFTCSECGKSYKLRSILKAHAIRHTKPYQCTLCEQRFPGKQNLSYHMRVHTGERPYQCPTCSKRFALQNALTSHMRQHTGERPFACDQCPLTFLHPDGLSRHKIKHQDDQKPVECELCTKRFSCYADQRRHLLSHTGEKPYKCNICLKSFPDTHRLRRHVNSHNNEKRFQCEQCLNLYKDSGKLLRHMWVHKENNMFECDLCQKSFLGPHNLLRHKKIAHENGKLFWCTFCEDNNDKVRFSDVSKLDRHLRSHIGERPYFCEVCNAEFSTTYMKEEHVKKGKHSKNRVKMITSVVIKSEGNQNDIIS